MCLLVQLHLFDLHRFKKLELRRLFLISVGVFFLVCKSLRAVFIMFSLMSRPWYKNKTSTVLIYPVVSRASLCLSPWATGIAAGLFTPWLISPLSLMSQDVKGCEFNIDFIKYFYCNMSVRISLNLKEAQALSWICTQCGSLTLRLFTRANALFIRVTVCCESRDSTQPPAISVSCIHSISALCIH